MSHNSPFKKVSSKIVYQNAWIKIHEDDVIRPDGSKGIYGYMESNNSVQVAAINENRELYLVRAYRYPTDTWGWELPGGGGEGEEAIIASRRELAEETGITAKKWTLLGKPLVCNGLMTERQAVLLAEDITVGTRISSDDDDLVTDGRFMSFTEIDQLIENGDIDDGMTLTCLFLVNRHLSQRAD